MKLINKTLNKYFVNIFNGISQRNKVFIGISSAMVVSVLLWTNATPQSQGDERILNMVTKLNERLQTECRCPIEINVGMLSTEANRGAMHGVHETVRNVARLCRKDDQKVCAGIQNIRFESMSEKLEPLASYATPEEMAMRHGLGGPSGIKLESGTLIVPLSSEMGHPRRDHFREDPRLMGQEVARLLGIN